jgi:hypothetical protein
MAHLSSRVQPLPQEAKIIPQVNIGGASAIVTFTGEGAVHRAGRRVPNFRETRDYVARGMNLLGG